MESNKKKIKRSLMIVFVFFLSFSFAIVATAENAKVSELPKEAIKALYIAQQALKEKNYEESINVLLKYMETAKEAIPIPAFQMLGHSYYQKNNKEKAREVFGMAHEAFPKNVEMLKNFAILTYDIGRLEEAAHLFEKLFELKGKTDSKILYQAAGLYFQAEALIEAKRVLNELLVSNSEPEMRWYEDIIAVCVELKEREAAEYWAKETLKRNPGQSKYWRFISQMRLEREEYASAAGALEIAYRLENTKSKEWLELANLYVYLNAPLMAIRCMDAAYGPEIPNERKVEIAHIYARTQRFDKGMEYLSEAIKEKPSADLLFQKGKILYDAMKYEAAIVILDQCIKMDPKYGDAYILAGFAAWNIKKFHKARSEFAGASILPKFREQANDAVSVLDDLMAAMTENPKLDS
jgi:tetratricopeptide (TPR) repeat protein